MRRQLKKQYDFVFLTNTPSFYKLNLCNEISKTHKVLIVLYGYGTEAVNTVLNNGEKYYFDYAFIHTGDSNKRNKFITFINLISLIRHIKYRKILYSGWMSLEYNIFSFISPRSKNVIICESSIWDVSLNGIKGWIKRMIIWRMSAALPSGKPHKALFDSIGFKGKINVTGSVGIFNKGEKHLTHKNNPLRYIYVGRLIDVKNVSLLIKVFNANGKSLTIVGTGELEEELKSIANSNIIFKGFIDNNKLGEIYQNHDVFILPSFSETWGLVVEEAIYWGLPVIVSDRVGCSIDMVKDLKTGIIFQSQNYDSLQNAIETMEENYDNYKLYVDAVNFTERDKNQIDAYLDLLK